MTYFQARSEGAWGRLSSVRHIIEADSIVTGEMDKYNLPLFLKAMALCGREARADGVTASRWSRDLCVQCSKKAGFR